MYLVTLDKLKIKGRGNQDENAKKLKASPLISNVLFPTFFVHGFLSSIQDLLSAAFGGVI